MAEIENADRAARPWWRENATLIAVIGLVITMVFNTLGVWLQFGQSRLANEQAELAAREAAQSRIDTQVGLVTQLNALAADAERDVVAAGVPSNSCDITFVPSAKERAVVHRAAQYYDYLAWLFRQRAIVLEPARQYATPAMIDIFELSKDVFGMPEVARTYPNLRRFAISRATEPPADPCR